MSHLSHQWKRETRAFLLQITRYREFLIKRKDVHTPGAGNAAAFLLAHLQFNRYSPVQLAAFMVRHAEKIRLVIPSNKPSWMDKANELIETCNHIKTVEL